MPPISKSLESITHDAPTNVENQQRITKNGREMECLRSDAAHCEIQYRERDKTARSKYSFADH